MQKEIQLNIHENLNNLYIKKYKQLYEKSERENIKLTEKIQSTNKILEIAQKELSDKKYECDKLL